MVNDRRLALAVFVLVSIFSFSGFATGLRAQSTDPFANLAGATNPTDTRSEVPRCRHGLLQNRCAGASQEGAQTPARWSETAVSRNAAGPSGTPCAAARDVQPGSATIDATPAQSGLTIVVISDLNGSYGSVEYGHPVHDAVAFIRRTRPDLVICAGDMIAGQSGKLTDGNLRAMWEAFDATLLQPLQADGIPFAFTLGNHDGSGSDAFARERRIATTFWRDRRSALAMIDDTGYPAHYSLVFGEVFIGVIDASTATLGNEQLNWLRRQLGSDAARGARLRVVVGHLPMRAVAEGRNTAGNVLREADQLHELLEGCGADWYISGHHHAYYLSRQGNLRMLHAGALGGGPRRLLGSDRAPMPTITTLRLGPSDRDFRIVTRDLTTGRVIPSSELPATVAGFNGVSHRFDP